MIGLDATYSLGRNLSGVGVYSREILYGLAAMDDGMEWDWFYRSNRYFKAGWNGDGLPANARRRLLLERWGSRRADLFHGLNQRLPLRRFRKQVATFHDLFVLTGEYSSPEFRERFAAQARHAAEAADLVIAVSEFTARQVTRLLGVPKERIVVVPHGVVPRVLPNVAREKLVLCVGAIQRRKNQAGLVRAFRAMPADWRLVLAGSEGFKAGETLEAAREFGDRILVTGYLSEAELAGWYARASIFAFPSIDEGFGMPVLEAMAAGVPVVAGNRSALPEVCGDAAILVNPLDEAELAGALEDLAKSPARLAELAALGLVRAKDFSWQRAVLETAAAYRRIL